jgi:hypothetical protein
MFVNTLSGAVTRSISVPFPASMAPRSKFTLPPLVPSRGRKNEHAADRAFARVTRNSTQRLGRNARCPPRRACRLYVTHLNRIGARPRCQAQLEPLLVLFWKPRLSSQAVQSI